MEKCFPRISCASERRESAIRRKPPFACPKPLRGPQASTLDLRDVACPDSGIVTHIIPVSTELRSVTRSVSLQARIQDDGKKAAAASPRDRSRRETKTENSDCR